MKKWLIPTIVFVVIIGAILIYLLTRQNETKAVTRAEVLKELYNKVQELEPPIDFTDNFSSSSFYFCKGNDTLIFPNNSMLFGALKDTSRFFTFVQIEAGDSYYPFLITFNKSGKLLSSQTLWTGGHGDCGYTSESKSVLTKDLKIEQYSNEESQECDDGGPIGPKTFTESTQTGYINKKGKIIMNKPVVKEWIVKDSTAITTTQPDSL